MTSKPRVVASIEARMTSSRLPGKVLMQAAGKPMLQILIERLKKVNQIDSIVIATTINNADEPIAALAKQLGVSCFRGSEEDVLERVCGALKQENADVCVEITGDCPLIDPHIIQEMIQAYFETKDQHVYVSNSDPERSVPAGLDVQVFSAKALYTLSDETKDPLDREHVSYGFYRPETAARWKARFIKHESTRGAEDFWITLDYKEDYEFIKALYEDLAPKNPNFGARETIAWIKAHPDWHDRCMALHRNILPA